MTMAEIERGAEESPEFEPEGDWEGLVERVYEEPAASQNGFEPPSAVTPSGRPPSNPVEKGETLEEEIPAETAVLGAALVDVDAARLALTHLELKHFRNHDARAVFDAIQRVAPEDGPPDPVAVAEDLVARHGRRLLAYLHRAMAWPTAANARSYVGQVLEHWVERRQEVLVREAAAAKTAEGRRHWLDEIRALDEMRLVDAPAAPKLKVITGDALMSTYYPPLDWLVGSDGEGLLYRGGVTLLTASHKRGKSLSALGLAVAGLVRRHVFPGDDEPEFLGTKVSGAGPVVYCSAEGGPRLVKVRVAKIESTLGQDLRHLVVVAEPPLPRIDTQEGLDALAGVVREAQAVLVIIDPLSWFIRLENERDAGPVRDIVERLRKWAEALNVGVLLVHHLKHVEPDATPTASGGRGSSEWANAVDTVISLWPDDDGDRKTSRVVFASRWGDPEPCKVRVNDETLLVEFVCRLGGEKNSTGDVGVAVRKATDLDLLKALRALGRWVRPSEWAEAGGLKKRQMHERIPGLLATGQVATRPASRGGMEYLYQPNDRADCAVGGTAQSESEPE